MKDRPIISIEKEKFDLMLDVVGVLLLVLLIGIPAFYYGAVPDSVPSHFNASGDPDDYSGKWIVWLLPVIGAVIYFGLGRLARLPHKFNYPFKLTKENTHRIYTQGSRMVKFMSLIILGAFSYINYSVVQTSLGNTDGLGNLFLPIFLCIIFGSIFLFSFKMKNNNK